MKNTIVHIGLALSLITLATAATTILTFEGPGYVSQNLKYTYPAAGTSAWGSLSGVSFSFFLYPSYRASIDFYAPAGEQLTAGSYYEDPGQYLGAALFDEPSFNLINRGKVLSPIPEGWFKVIEIVVDQYGPKKVAVDFVTYDAAGKHTAGSLRWNTDIPVTPTDKILQMPEVSTTSFLLIGALGLIVCRRRRT
jgi:hypothetical protein